jgi:hypothetical protein
MRQVNCGDRLPKTKDMGDIYDCLLRHAPGRPCTPAAPPMPLILGAWNSTNDVQKMQRWEETLTWAARNGCLEYFSELADVDFYCVVQPTTCNIGPLGGPMHQEWDFKPKVRPEAEPLSRHLMMLQSNWADIVGPELAAITRPLDFTGAKARRLLAFAQNTAIAPWGRWSPLSANQELRRKFTRFRAAINAAIAPHEVDHMDFTAEMTG